MQISNFVLCKPLLTILNINNARIFRLWHPHAFRELFFCFSQKVWVETFEPKGFHGIRLGRLSINSWSEICPTITDLEPIIRYQQRNKLITGREQRNSLNILNWPATFHYPHEIKQSRYFLFTLLSLRTFL